MSTEHYLLILACSQRKLDNQELLPAVERYDGGSFRVLRKVKREKKYQNRINVLILSAKYGLIEGLTPIANYELKINKQKSKELNPQVMRVLKNSAKNNDYSEIYIDLGKKYLPALKGIEDLFPRSQLIFARGRIGERLKQLKNWLEAKARN